MKATVIKPRLLRVPSGRALQCSVIPGLNSYCLFDIELKRAATGSAHHAKVPDERHEDDGYRHRQQDNQ